MPTSITEYLSDISIGSPVSHARLTLFPLRGNAVSTLDYLIVDEAAHTGQVTVEETPDGGTVPSVRVRSRSDRPVFVPDGTTLVGGQQDRTVNISLMLAPNSETTIPVSCIERGRWSSETPGFTLMEHSDFRMRAKMCWGATNDFAMTHGAQVQQGIVWDDIDSAIGHCQAISDTDQYHAGFGAWEEEISEYEASLSCPSNAAGVAVCLDGHVMTIDLFDRPSTLHCVWARLSRSYAFGALRRPVKENVFPDLASFLRHASRAHVQAKTAVGIGTSLSLRTDETIGSALVISECLAHLSLFANELHQPSKARTSIGH